MTEAGQDGPLRPVRAKHSLFPQRPKVPRERPRRIGDTPGDDRAARLWAVDRIAPPSAGAAHKVTISGEFRGPNARHRGSFARTA